MGPRWGIVAGGRPTAPGQLCRTSNTNAVRLPHRLTCGSRVPRCCLACLRRRVEAIQIEPLVSTSRFSVSAPRLSGALRVKMVAACGARLCNIASFSLYVELCILCISSELPVPMSVGSFARPTAACVMRDSRALLMHTVCTVSCAAECDIALVCTWPTAAIAFYRLSCREVSAV